MGRKKKNETWLPADPIRIRAFAREFASKVLNLPVGQPPKVGDIQNALCLRRHSLNLADTTLQNWINGEDKPNATAIEWIRREWPGCADWLEPDIESSAVRRFLCALDVWGSPIDSPARRLDEVSTTTITVGKVLRVLAKRWAPKPTVDRKSSFSGGFIISRLKCRVPEQVPFDIYESINPLTLIDFMFRCGPYLELDEEDFAEWAIDLASLTLLIAAFYEGIPLVERLQLSASENCHGLLDSLFFRPHDRWPNLASLKNRLADFSEVNDLATDYSQRLLDARELVQNEFLSIGSDLSIVEMLSSRVNDRSKMWQVPLDTNGETFAQGDLVRGKRNISPAAPGRYQYELQTQAEGKKVALCHDLKNASQAPLLERSDLYGGYKGEFDWGYSGAGPTFLAISILAHHLGHDDFDSDEIDRLLIGCISRFPRLLTGSIFLTTELIDKCLNDQSSRI